MHARQRVAHFQIRQHIDEMRLLQANAQGAFQRIVEHRLTGQVVQAAHHHPITLGKGNGRLRPQEHVERYGQQRQHHQGLDHHRCRPSPERHFAVRLARPRRRLEGRQAFFAHLEHRHRVRHTAEAVAAMGAPTHFFEPLAQLALRAMRQCIGNVGQQDLTRKGQGHQARGDRFDQSLDLDRLGSAGDIFGAVFPHHHVADMDPDPRRQIHRFGGIELAQGTLIVQRKGSRLHRPLEHQEETVGLVDLAACVAVHQGARQAIMLADQFRRRQIAQSFHQCGGFHQITNQQGTQLRTNRGARLRVLGHAGVHKRAATRIGDGRSPILHGHADRCHQQREAC